MRFSSVTIMVVFAVRRPHQIAALAIKLVTIKMVNQSVRCRGRRNAHSFHDLDMQI